VYIFPEDLVASDLKKVSLTDQQVYDITGIISVNRDKPAKLSEILKTIYVPKCVKPSNSSSCAIAGGRKRTGRRVRKSRRRATTRRRSR